MRYVRPVLPAGILHGTYAGYQWEYKWEFKTNGKYGCLDCRRAKNRYMDGVRKRKAATKCYPGLGWPMAKTTY